jgi:hypothetical protein
VITTETLTDALSAPVRLAIAALLAAAAAVTAWGVWANGLFAQPIWTAEGLWRLAILAAVYAAGTAAFLRFWPHWFVRATLIAAGLYTVASVGVVPVAGTLLFLLSSFVLGTLLTGTAEVLALLVGLAVWMAAISVAAHFPVNYAWVYAVAFAAPLAVKPERTRECLRECLRLVGPVRFESRGTAALAALAGFPLLCHLLVALKPEAATDALAVHLMLPAWVSWQHYWPFDFRHVSWAVMPLGADWCFTAAYMLGGEFAARLLNFSILALIAALVYAGARRFVTPATAFLCVGVFASTPLVQLLTGSLFVENVWAVFVTGAVLALDRFHASSAPRWLYVAAGLTDSALATKFGALAFAIPAAAFAAWVLFRRRKTIHGTARVAALAAALVLLAGAPVYVYAYATTGNPVFPFLNHVFQSPWFDATRNLTDPRYRTPLSLTTPYDIVFHSSRFLEAHDGALGFAYVLLLPLALVGLARRSQTFGKLAFALAAIPALVCFAGMSYARYLYPALPLFTIAGAAALGRISANRALFRAATALLLAALALNLYFLPSSNWYHADFFLLPFDRQATNRFYREVAPVRRLVEYMNRYHPGAPVGFFGTSHIAELKAPAYIADWHNYEYWTRVWATERPADYGDYSQSLGIKYFVTPQRLTTGATLPVLIFLRRYTTVESHFGQYDLRRLRPEAPVLWSGQHAVSESAPCDPDMIDGAAPQVRYTGSWKHVQRFGKACGGTLAYSASTGAEASFEFTGTSVSLIFTRAYTRGIAEVLLDGASRGPLDQFAPGIEWHARAVYGAPARGRHTLTVRVLGRRSEDAQGDDIDIDGFLVTP